MTSGEPKLTLPCINIYELRGCHSHRTEISHEWFDQIFSGRCTGVAHLWAIAQYQASAVVFSLQELGLVQGTNLSVSWRCADTNEPLRILYACVMRLFHLLNSERNFLTMKRLFQKWLQLFDWCGWKLSSEHEQRYARLQRYDSVVSNEMSRTQSCSCIVVNMFMYCHYSLSSSSTHLISTRSSVSSQSQEFV